MTIKVMNKVAPPYPNNLITSNTINTISVNKLIIKKPNTNFRKTYFFISRPKLWDGIPDAICNIVPNNKFKKGFTQYMSAKGLKFLM